MSEWIVKLENLREQEPETILADLPKIMEDQTFQKDLSDTSHSEQQAIHSLLSEIALILETHQKTMKEQGIDIVQRMKNAEDMSNACLAYSKNKNRE